MELSAKARALESLAGLSMGDAFGERFVGKVESVLPRIARRILVAIQQGGDGRALSRAGFGGAGAFGAVSLAESGRHSYRSSTLSR